jgi:hypothetical protein
LLAPRGFIHFQIKRNKLSLRLSLLVLLFVSDQSYEAHVFLGDFNSIGLRLVQLHFEDEIGITFLATFLYLLFTIILILKLLNFFIDLLINKSNSNSLTLLTMLKLNLLMKGKIVIKLKSTLW